MHEPGNLLLLPNAWDLTSARVVERSGFEALGTTSLATAFGAGVPDGAGGIRDATIDLAGQLGRLRGLVSIDIEDGFSRDPGEVADTVRALVAAGAVGFNIEDGRTTGALAPASEQIAKIRACRQVDADVFINARVDTYWVGASGGEAAVEEVIDRARRYLDAGADGIFIPALTDAELIGRYCAAIPAPINILYSPAGLGVSELNAAGVARLSTGSFLFRNAAGATADALTAIAGGALPGAAAPAYSEFAG